MSDTTTVPVTLKIAEVAAVFRKDASTVRRWVRRGELQAHVPVETIGGQHYVRTVELEKFVGRPITIADLQVAS